LLVPSPNGGGFFDIRSDSVSQQPGDYNSDGSVDSADYVIWRKNDGSQAGYNTWRAHFGQTAGSGAAIPSADPLSAAVPEPGTWALLVCGLVIARLVRSRIREQDRHFVLAIPYEVSLLPA
jgi:hypothetical protein